MMGREKEIEEIAKIIARRSVAFRNPNVAFMTTARKTADSIYKAGYRKQSEVAKEIFDAIKEKLIFNTYGIATISNKTFCELKKKYTENEDSE